mmetsp:Transcript_26139/g.83026  ORF Transcript_26139/g.83026 Transcript_26139/m.83026 type:complete len:204 (+) Transcript_26139:590-1201(+)
MCLPRPTARAAPPPPSSPQPSTPPAPMPSTPPSTRPSPSPSADGTSRSTSLMSNAPASSPSPTAAESCPPDVSCANARSASISAISPPTSPPPPPTSPCCWRWARRALRLGAFGGGVRSLGRSSWIRPPTLREPRAMLSVISSTADSVSAPSLRACARRASSSSSWRAGSIGARVRQAAPQPPAGGAQHSHLARGLAPHAVRE